MDNKKDNAEMLSTILKFYKFKICMYEGMSSICLETYKDEKIVEMETYDGIFFNHFISEDDLLKEISTHAKSFIWDVCNPKQVQNIFLGCKSLEEVHVKIDLNANLKV